MLKLGDCFYTASKTFTFAAVPLSFAPCSDSCSRSEHLIRQGNGQSIALAACGLFLCLITSFCQGFRLVASELVSRVGGGFTPAGFALVTSCSDSHSACLSTSEHVFGEYINHQRQSIMDNSNNNSATLPSFTILESENSPRFTLSKRRAILKRVIATRCTDPLHRQWTECFICGVLNVSEINRLTHDNISEAMNRMDEMVKKAGGLWA